MRRKKPRVRGSLRVGHRDGHRAGREPARLHRRRERDRYVFRIEGDGRLRRELYGRPARRQHARVRLSRGSEPRNVDRGRGARRGRDRLVEVVGPQRELGRLPRQARARQRAEAHRGGLRVLRNVRERAPIRLAPLYRARNRLGAGVVYGVARKVCHPRPHGKVDPRPEGVRRRLGPSHQHVGRPAALDSGDRAGGSGRAGSGLIAGRRRAQHDVRIVARAGRDGLVVVDSDGAVSGERRVHVRGRIVVYRDAVGGQIAALEDGVSGRRADSVHSNRQGRRAVRVRLRYPVRGRESVRARAHDRRVFAVHLYVAGRDGAYVFAGRKRYGQQVAYAGMPRVCVGRRHGERVSCHEKKVVYDGVVVVVFRGERVARGVRDRAGHPHTYEFGQAVFAGRAGIDALCAYQVGLPGLVVYLIRQREGHRAVGFGCRSDQVAGHVEVAALHARIHQVLVELYYYGTRIRHAGARDRRRHGVRRDGYGRARDRLVVVVRKGIIPDGSGLHPQRRGAEGHCVPPLLAGKRYGYGGIVRRFDEGARQRHRGQRVAQRHFRGVYERRRRGVYGLVERYAQYPGSLVECNRFHHRRIRIGRHDERETLGVRVLERPELRNLVADLRGRSDEPVAGQVRDRPGGHMQRRVLVRRYGAPLLRGHRYADGGAVGLGDGGRCHGGRARVAVAHGDL